MKRKCLLAIILVVAQFLSATDFTLSNGIVIFGKLRGIKAQQMYIVDTNKNLHIVPFDDVVRIQDGKGDVADKWKQKLAFMDINPDAYTIKDTFAKPVAPVASDPQPGSTQYTLISQAMASNPGSPNQNQPNMALTNKQLKRIADALWTANIAVGIMILGGIVYGLSQAN